jgi:hypothetical protein
MFILLALGINSLKLYFFIPVRKQNKLERFYLACFSG